jgi:hypothetical protein
MEPTFKEYLMEYYDTPSAPSFNAPEEGKQDVSMHGDEELIDWVMNDEELYHVARNARSFDDLMDNIDTLFTYNNDQYNTLARAFRMGDLRDEGQEEEIEQKMPAMKDTTRHFANQFDREVIQKRNKDDIKRSAVSSKRYKQRQARDDRRYHGK